jgi:3-isopropylmalate/(R)-2-methylmalate dehydratase small subunit
MADMILRGTAWVAPGYVMAYDIIKQQFWTSRVDPTENAKWVMAGVAPEFDAENAFASRGYRFIVAGHNFAGGGKSIEHVITGLMGAGIVAVLADSFARLQFRNAINYGLPFITSRGIREQVHTGDELEVNLTTGSVRNVTRDTGAQAAPVPAFVQEVAAAGGMIPFVREHIARGTMGSLR